MKITEKRIKSFGILLVLSIIAIGVGVTYAFFDATILNRESASTVVVNSGDSKITYDGGENPNIIGSYLSPGWSSDKTFKITAINTTIEPYDFDININVLNSNFFTSFSSTDNRETYAGSSNLMYTLSSCDSAFQNCEVITGPSAINKNNPDGTSTDNIAKIYTKSIAASSGTTELYYSLKIEFPDLEDTIQTQRGVNNERLTFSGYVTVTSSTIQTLDQESIPQS